MLNLNQLLAVTVTVGVSVLSFSSLLLPNNFVLVQKCSIFYSTSTSAVNQQNMKSDAIVFKGAQNSPLKPLQRCRAKLELLLEKPLSTFRNIAARTDDFRIHGFTSVNLLHSLQTEN